MEVAILFLVELTDTNGMCRQARCGIFNVGSHASFHGAPEQQQRVNPASITLRPRSFAHFCRPKPSCPPWLCGHTHGDFTFVK